MGTTASGLAMWERKRGSYEDRYWSRVVVVEDCWEWTGDTINTGYGKMSVNGREVLVHRWAYEHFNRPIPEGMEIDHLCRNHRCVKPGHLEAVTAAENQRRGVGTFAALNAAKTHCPHGHLLDGVFENNGRPRRYCKECNRQRVGRYMRAGYYRNGAHRRKESAA